MIKRILSVMIAAIIAILIMGYSSEQKATAKNATTSKKVVEREKTFTDKEFIEIVSKKLSDKLYESITDDKKLMSSLAKIPNKSGLYEIVRETCEALIARNYEDNVKQAFLKSGQNPSKKAIKDFVKKTKKPLITKTSLYLYQRLLPLVIPSEKL